MTNLKASKLKIWKENFINSFRLSTYKITLIGVFLALTTLVSLLEIPTFFNSFLTIDFSNTIILLAVLVVKLPYGLLIACVFPWLRLVIPHTVPPNVIGELANMLSSITVLLVYFSLSAVFKLKTNNWKIVWGLDVTISILTILLVSLMNIFYNWAFILDLYGVPQYKLVLWTLLFPYNLFKFFLVFSLFLILKRPLVILKNNFNL